MRKLIVLAAAAATLLVGACNTISGIGRDAQAAVTFQAQLGSLADKSARITALAVQIAQVARFDVAAAQLAAKPDPVLDWIALHETTHSVQFAAAPWLRSNALCLS